MGSIRYVRIRKTDDITRTDMAVANNAYVGVYIM
jgi:hypothetical protein